MTTDSTTVAINSALVKLDGRHLGGVSCIYLIANHRKKIMKIHVAYIDSSAHGITEGTLMLDERPWSSVPSGPHIEIDGDDIITYSPYAILGEHPEMRSASDLLVSASCVKRGEPAFAFDMHYERGDRIRVGDFILNEASFIYVFAVEEDADGIRIHTLTRVMRVLEAHTYLIIRLSDVGG